MAHHQPHACTLILVERAGAKYLVTASVREIDPWPPMLQAAGTRMVEVSPRSRQETRLTQETLDRDDLLTWASGLTGGTATVELRLDPSVQDLEWEEALGWDRPVYRRRRARTARVRSRLPLRIGLRGNVPETEVLSDLVLQVSDGQVVAWAHVQDHDDGPFHILHAPIDHVPEPPGPPTRLLVIEADEATPPDQLAALASGYPNAHAVLVVAGHEADRRAFLQTWYHVVLHDEPLDRCLAETRARTSAFARTVLTLQPTAELDLMLSRIAAELRAGLGRTPRQAVVGPSTLAQMPRLHRAGVDLRDKAFAQLRPPGEAFVRRLEDLSRQPFDSEAHAIFQIGAVASNGGHEEAAAAMDFEEAAPEEVAQSATRFTQAWLSALGAEAVLGRDVTLDESVSLRVRIAADVPEGVEVAVFPQAVLAHLTDVSVPVDLDVVVFHDDAVRLPERSHRLTLPPVGPTETLAFRVDPRRAGAVQLRVCLYFGNVLLQSLAVRFDVAADLASARVGSARVSLDFVASDLLLLDEEPQPTVTLFANRAGDSHWIGVFDQATPELRNGQTRAFAEDTLHTAAEALRAALVEAHGAPGVGYGYAKPLDDAGERDRRNAKLCALAKHGYTLYDALFESAAGVDGASIRSLRKALEAPGTVSIARCAPEAPSVPWAALYDAELDPELPVSLCAFADQHLEEGLPDPVACRASAECPLGAGANVVCPWGFWGMRHQVEQPFETVDPSDPTESVALARRERSVLPFTGPHVRMIYGFDPGLNGGDAHGDSLATVPDIELSRRPARSEVKQALEGDDAPLFYVHCHGALEEGFKLLLREGAEVQPLAAASLKVRGDPAERPGFLVILNACDSVATRPELLGSFAFKLRNLGAVGVVGTEISVATTFAREFGEQLVEHMLARHEDIGTAFLALRRDGLRTRNPSGLLFNYYAVRTLHLEQNP